MLGVKRRSLLPIVLHKHYCTCAHSFLLHHRVQPSAPEGVMPANIASTHNLLQRIPHALSPVFGGMTTNSFSLESHAIAAETAEYCA